MKTQQIVAIFITCSVLGVFIKLGVDLSYKNKKTLEGKEFIGYIPKDALPQLNWGNDNGRWYDIHSIKTIIGKDTIYAHFLTDGMPGLKYVLYKGSYPPSIDTVVYVMGHYDQNGKPWIDSEASLTSLKE